MSDDDYWNAAMQRGMDVYDQVAVLRSAETQCWAVARKVPIDKQPPIVAICQGLTDEVNYLYNNMSDIDKAIEHPKAGPSERGQEASDKVYADTYVKGLNMSDADLQAATDDLLKQIHTSGMTPALRAKLHAYNDALNNKPFSPPLYDPNAKYPPPNVPEQPET